MCILIKITNSNFYVHSNLYALTISFDYTYMFDIYEIGIKIHYYLNFDDYHKFITKHLTK